MIKNVIKRDGSVQPFILKRVNDAIRDAYRAVGKTGYKKVVYSVRDILKTMDNEELPVERIQDIIEQQLMHIGDSAVAREFILFRQRAAFRREWVATKEEFIATYKRTQNTADATVDDNSNVASKNIGIMNNEIHKSDNIWINRYMILSKLRQIYPDFDAKQYFRDLADHVIYKHDESSFAGAVAPYCCAISMYPFLLNGLKQIGGLSAAPKNLDSFCGMYVNMIFAISAQFAGAVATPEFLLYFDYFARREWGDDYYKHSGKIIRDRFAGNEAINIRKQIHQYWQQVIYSINQPSAARGLQSAFVNFSYYDRAFYEGMFGNFYFPDGTQPQWESLNWLQREFMQWFNDERLRCMLTFPVESFALVYQNGAFADEDSAKFVAEEYARGHSFFTYISDSVDSLSSCCRLKNSLTTKEFSFTNGNLGVQTGSKSVITINLNRLVQDALAEPMAERGVAWSENTEEYMCILKSNLRDLLGRIYKYQNAYNELLWDMYDANLLPVYKAGFIHLDKQYLTIGINGLNEAAEYLGIACTDNPQYEYFCQQIFATIKEENTAHKTKRTMFNTECVPAESLAIKNYNWDKADGYVVPENRNLYASYIYVPSDESVDIFEKIRMHGRRFIGEYLDGGSAAHLNLDSHLSAEQYAAILKYAADEGCQYLTFNIPNSECDDCHYITKVPVDTCPKCGSKHITLYDRIIGYMTPIKNWSEGRRIEQATRVYESMK